MACCPPDEKYGYDDSRFEKDVDAHFHCSICYNVLKEPMMCRNNEHIFCRECITEHLNVNSHTCPECSEDLTVDTLRRARLVSNYLSELKIKCDYSDRGCQEYIRLAELDSHVQNCGFAPVKCSNEQCEMIISKRELIYHESTICEYRKVKCHNCLKIEKDTEKMRQKIEGLEKKMESIASDVQEVKGQLARVLEKFFENPIQMSSVNNTSNALMADIFVAGGKNKCGNALKTVERFCWKKNVWEKVPSLNLGRIGAALFVYENQLFVAGGCDSGIIEVLHLLASPLEWQNLEAALANKASITRSVVYENRALLFHTCGQNSDVTSVCTEVRLTKPYTCKEISNIPGPPRVLYAVVAFGHKILIFGGSGYYGYDDVNEKSVLEFDMNTKKYKSMRQLPYAVSNMAGVRWRDQAILIGGYEKTSGTTGGTKRVLMYDSKTGDTTELPPMLEDRVGCCAIITGDTIVVMGGMRKAGGHVGTVEAFTLGGYAWRYLPAMNDIRSVAAAVVLQ